MPPTLSSLRTRSLPLNRIPVSPTTLRHPARGQQRGHHPQIVCSQTASSRAGQGAVTWKAVGSSALRGPAARTTIIRQAPGLKAVGDGAELADAYPLAAEPQVDTFARPRVAPRELGWQHGRRLTRLISTISNSSTPIRERGVRAGDLIADFDVIIPDTTVSPEEWAEGRKLPESTPAAWAMKGSPPSRSSCRPVERW